MSVGVHLTLAIVSINGWNRLNVAARTVPGDYVPGSLAKDARGELIARAPLSTLRREVSPMRAGVGAVATRWIFNVSHLHLLHRADLSGARETA
jgi:hypothetical protein